MPVREMKLRIGEVTGIPFDTIHLFHPTPSGHPIRDIYGWKETWPWPADLPVAEVFDEMVIRGCGIAADAVLYMLVKINAFQSVGCFKHSIAGSALGMTNFTRLAKKSVVRARPIQNTRLFAPPLPPATPTS